MDVIWSINPACYELQRIIIYAEQDTLIQAEVEGDARRHTFHGLDMNTGFDVWFELQYDNHVETSEPHTFNPGRGNQGRQLIAL